MKLPIRIPPRRILNPGYPCTLCQVRPDVACRHRPADEDWSMGKDPPETDSRKGSERPGSGIHFRSRRAALTAGLKKR